MQHFLSEHLDLIGPGSRGRQREPAALFVFPDGTSLLVDVGDGNRAPPTGANRVPDGSRSAGEWIARYALGWLDDHDQCGDELPLGSLDRLRCCAGRCAASRTPGGRESNR
jgi:hypothetical protein